MITVAPVFTPSVQQRAYRAVLHAMAEPGRVVDLMSVTGASAAVSLLASVVDSAVSICDAGGVLDAVDRRMLAAADAPLDAADFIVTRGDRAPPDPFEPKTGDVYRPELGATIVVVVAAIGEGEAFTLRGPGIKSETILPVRGLDGSWLAARDRMNAGEPAGIDIALVDAARCVCLPRSTAIDAPGDTAGEGAGHAGQTRTAGRG